MQWIAHTIRAIFARNRLLGAAVIAVPMAIVIGAIVLLATRSDGDGEVVAAPDPVSATYSGELLDRLDTDPEQLVENVIAGIVPVEVSADELALLRADMADAISAPSSDPRELSDGLVRRLGLAAGDADDADDLVAALVSAIDPDGDVESTDDFVMAMRTWAAESTPHVLRVTSGQPTSGAVDIRELSFDGAVGALTSLGSAMNVVTTTIDGIDGLDALDVPGVRWEIDERARSITFTGDSDGLGDRARAIVAARWGDDPTPSFLAAIGVDAWRLSDVGFSGGLGEPELPPTVFVLAEAPGVIDAAAIQLSDVVGGELAIDRGITAFTTLDREALPSDIADLIDQGDAALRIRASLGSGFGAIDGTNTPTRVTISVEAPGLEPPALPDWVTASSELPWRLTLTTAATTGGDDLEIGFAGGLDVELDGEVRSFAASVSTAGTLVAGLRDPWTSPFGLEWLDLDTVTMTVDLDAGSTVARFDSEATVAGRRSTVTFEVATGGGKTSTTLQIAIDELSAAGAIEFLADVTGVGAPDPMPELSIADVLIDVRTGEASTVTLGGRSTLGSTAIDVVAGIENLGGDSALLFGVAIDEWSLVDLLPAVEGTVLEELEFPASAIVLSDVDADIDISDLAAPTRRFFVTAGVEGTLRLSPGVSLFSRLDLTGTALEAPLAAIGLDDGRLPLVGTLPGTAIGATSGPSGSGLSGLSLAAQLPDVAPGGAPDWFRGGRLSLVATGAPSLGLEGEMDVRIDGENLTFAIGAQFARVSAGVELALSGELATERPWESPFGIDWLTINDASVQLTVDPLGTVGLGFGGSVILGDRPIEVAIVTEISAGVPTNFAMQGASPDGLAFSDLLAVQGGIAGAAGAQPASLGDYPDLSIRDFELRFAPQAFERLGIEAGFALAGDVHIERDGSSVRFAALDVLLDENGFVGAGSLQGYDLGPIEWSDISLDLALTLSQQRFAFDGEASIFGLSGAASIDLNADSIFFTGRQFLDDLRRAVDLFEQLIDDPVGTIERLPEIFEAAGVPLPEWAEAIVDGLTPILERGVALSEEAIDIVLNGGTVPLPVSPPNGEDPGCLTPTPIRVDGRCYATPPIPATDGFPSGGEAKECSRATPSLSDGRCYTSRPKGEVCLASWKIGSKTYGMQLRGGKCYAKVKKVFGSGYNYLPDDGIEPTIDRGIPIGGVAPVCLIENPVEVGGRCYAVPPTPAVPGIPDNGAEPECKLFWSFEDGTCWRISPSQAAEGLGAPGICTPFGVECRLEDLISGELAETLFDGVMDRL